VLLGGYARGSGVDAEGLLGVVDGGPLFVAG